MNSRILMMVVTLTCMPFSVGAEEKVLSKQELISERCNPTNVDIIIQSYEWRRMYVRCAELVSHGYECQASIERDLYLLDEERRMYDATKDTHIGNTETTGEASGRELMRILRRGEKF